MRTTVTIDDTLLANARAYSGITDIGPLVREVLTKYVQGEAARRLAAMGGTQKGVVFDVPRRRFPADDESE